MKQGFFWNYLEYNSKEPVVEKERDYPCKYIDPKTSNNYLFKVTYFEKKINIFYCVVISVIDIIFI